ncbi:MAG: type II toxin-antitoxin system HicB family antitoxin [Halopenitus sp.]
MGTERDGNGEDPTPPPRITLQLSECGDLWVVTDEETGVTTQGETREEALAMIEEAVALHRGEAGEPIDDEEAFFEDLGIDPDTIEGAGKPPWF